MTANLDISCLRVLKYRERYEAMARAVPPQALQPRTVSMLKAFGRFFNDFPDVAKVTPEEFGIFFRSAYPKLSDDDHAVYAGVFRQVAEDAPPGVEAGLMRRLLETATAADLAKKLSDFEDGQEVDLRGELTAFLDRYDTHMGKVAKDPQVRDPIEDLMRPEDETRGFTWPWECLNRNMRPLLPGDFVIVAARPDAGKTTWLTQATTHWAPQLSRVYPDEQRDILWGNNEGPGKRIVARAFQSALGATSDELVSLVQTPPPKGQERYGNMARYNYVQAIGGRGGALRVFDIHDYTTAQFEDTVLRRYKPGLIVVDMPANLKFSGAGANGGERTDQLLEALAQWARVRGVKYDCPVVATWQLSNDADGIPYPTLPQLKDSKTGVQGAADAIIVIGKSNDVMLENSRFFSTTKNKLRRAGQPQLRMEVSFDGARGLYSEAR